MDFTEIQDIQDITDKKAITYPTEITFKVIFRDDPSTLDSIKAILAKKYEEDIEDKKDMEDTEDIENINYSINTTPSRNSKFISYTITASFSSEESLNTVCNKISTLAGYMTMF
jgi:putative lipoic acid-binding regulatory protein